ncbi:MAG: hypothetical protein HPY67_02255 [Syntrophaceae bacterium]|nr:hypothetical protein [Syntrophaceae bacterium]
MRARVMISVLTVLTILLSGTLAAAQTAQDTKTPMGARMQTPPVNPADDPKGPVGSLTGRTAGATTADLLSLGSVWQVQECCGWSGTWTRRAGTNVFDAKWRHTNGSQAQDVITLQSWNKATNEVVLKRQNLNGTYKATVNPAARTLTNGSASWYPAGEKWSARY